MSEFPGWHRVASVPLDHGRFEAIVCIFAGARAADPGVQLNIHPSPGNMTPSEARMLAAALVAASREAEEAT